MFHFGLNDCFVEDCSNDILIKHLTETIKQFKHTKTTYPQLVEGVLTDRLPSKIILNKLGLSLSDCINYLDRDLKRIAYSYFNKYPVEDYLSINDYDNLIDKGYTILIENKEYDAMNVKLLQDNDGILFSLAAHKDLEKNKIEIQDLEKNSFEILNLYGKEGNTNYICDFLRNEIVKKADGFDKLLTLVKECRYNARFKKDFEILNYSTQQFLLKEIQYAINRNEKTRFYPDDKLIKDVTPKSEGKIKIFELRIFSPVALRMYFYETPEIVYLASIDGKPKKKAQDQDIYNSISIIRELLLKIKG